jgi:hypothetical protein
MATPKEQHDARPNARNIGYGSGRSRPADATPPGGIRAMAPADPAGDAEPHDPSGGRPAAPLDGAGLDAQVAPQEPTERA